MKTITLTDEQMTVLAELLASRIGQIEELQSADFTNGDYLKMLQSDLHELDLILDQVTLVIEGES